MRIKFTKQNYTKAERVLGRILQENKIEFKTKQMINNREIDFLIGNLAIEVDGHSQVESKNNNLLLEGLIPLHFLNQDIINNRKKVAEKLIDIAKTIREEENRRINQASTLL